MNTKINLPNDNPGTAVVRITCGLLSYGLSVIAMALAVFGVHFSDFYFIKMYLWYVQYHFWTFLVAGVISLLFALGSLTRVPGKYSRTILVASAKIAAMICAVLLVLAGFQVLDNRLAFFANLFYIVVFVVGLGLVTRQIYQLTASCRFKGNWIAIPCVFTSCVMIAICPAAFIVKWNNCPNLTVADIQSGREAFSRKYTAESVAISNDGHWMAATVRIPRFDTNSFNTETMVWELPTGMIIKEMSRSSAYYYSKLVFSPNGKDLAYNTDGNSVSIMHLGTRISRQIIRVDSDSNIGALIYSPNGRYLAALGSETIIYDVMNKQIYKRKPITGVPIQFMNDGNIYASVAGSTYQDKSCVYMLDSISGKKQMILSLYDLRKIGISDDGKIHVLINKGNKWYVKRFNQTGKIMERMVRIKDFYGLDSSIFSRDCKLLISSIQSRSLTAVKVFSTRDGKLQQQFTGGEPTGISGNNKYIVYSRRAHDYGL